MAKKSYSPELIWLIAAFVFNGMFAAMNNRKDALLIGVKAVSSEMSKKIPFGRVFVAIGKEGLPEDVEVAPISRLARESKKSELEVEMSWKHDGSILISPEEFAEFLDKVEREILDGSASLPMAVDEVIKRIS